MSYRPTRPVRLSTPRENSLTFDVKLHIARSIDDDRRERREARQRRRQAQAQAPAAPTFTFNVRLPGEDRAHAPGTQ